MKRSFDIVVSFCGLVVVAPLLAVLSLWIIWDSRGPAFYRGVRAGRFGRPFRIYKLRTMARDSEQTGGSETPADDPRITRAGHFLRKYKLDELPQLINVLKGEMSLVGPRPEVMDEVVLYTAREKQLLQVRPGITDWASIRFRDEDEILRGRLDPHRAYHELIRPEKIRLGLEYVRTRSFVIDLQILWMTLLAVLTPAERQLARPRTVSFLSDNRENELAVDSGNRVRTQPLAPWPDFSEDEVAAACNVLRSGKVNYWTGEQGLQFEKEFAAYLGCSYAVAVANGTVALEIALKALGIGPGHEVVVPSRTFIASASAVVQCGATPIIADVDRESQNLTAATVERVLSPRTRAIITVHLAGWPCDMDAILKLAHHRNLKVLEDCAQAHGATYRGAKVGALGDAGAFSFCQDKIMSTGGEGGMITTNDEATFEAAWSYKDHGKNYRAMQSRTPSPDFRWVHDSFGTNGRLTEMQAAIGRVLLPKLDERVAQRRANAAALSRAIVDVPGLRLTTPPAEVGHAYYKYYAFVQQQDLQDEWDRDRIAAAIRAEGIPCTSGSCSEIYLEKAFSSQAGTRDRLPVAGELGETSLMFLVHSTLHERDMLDTALAIRKVLQVATKPCLKSWVRERQIKERPQATTGLSNFV